MKKQVDKTIHASVSVSNVCIIAVISLIIPTLVYTSLETRGSHGDPSVNRDY